MNQQTRLILTTIVYMQKLQNGQNCEVIAEEKPDRKFNIRFWIHKQITKDETQFSPARLSNAEG